MGRPYLGLEEPLSSPERRPQDPLTSRRGEGSGLTPFLPPSRLSAVAAGFAGLWAKPSDARGRGAYR
jgi:hypothetical protein